MLCDLCGGKLDPLTLAHVDAPTHHECIQFDSLTLSTKAMMSKALARDMRLANEWRAICEVEAELNAESEHDGKP